MPAANWYKCVVHGTGILTSVCPVQVPQREQLILGLPMCVQEPEYIETQAIPWNMEYDASVGACPVGQQLCNIDGA